MHGCENEVFDQKSLDAEGPNDVAVEATMVRCAMRVLLEGAVDDQIEEPRVPSIIVVLVNPNVFKCIIRTRAIEP